MAKKFGGMGVMLIDEVNRNNRIEMRGGRPQIFYELSAKDKKRMAYGVSEAAKILLKSGAKRVVVLTYENILGRRTWRQGLSIKTLKEADYFEKNLKLVPNKTLLMGAHMLGANKLGVDPKTSVVDPNHQVWGVNQLYVVDASILPSSPGANPMTTIYTVAKLFVERHLHKLNKETKVTKDVILMGQGQHQERN
jgi:choline dehydrogenase-like flavoprotein